MVLLAAGVFDNAGKALFVRCYVEMGRARLESLTASFSKLCLGNEDKQSTFTETDSVRYCYLPMEDLYMVLITSKISDIIEDMEVNRLLVSLVGKIAPSFTEEEIYESRFDIINAFDEVISFKGRKEKVNLEQIKCFVEMESHDEKVYEMEVAEKKKKALEIRKQKEYEIRQQQAMMHRTGIMGGMGSMGSMGGMSVQSAPVSQPAMQTPVQQPPVRQGPSRKGLVLGKKVESAFMEKIAKEDKALVEKPRVEHAPAQPQVNKEPQHQNYGEFAPPAPSFIEVEHKPVHITITEHLNTIINNEGSVKAYEVTGELALNLSSVDYSNASFELDDFKSGFQLKTHPKVDKNKFSNKIIASSSGSFPVNSNITVLRWKGDMKTDKELPVSVSCWASYSPNELSLTISCESENPTNLYDIGVAIPTPGAPKSLNTPSGEAEYVEDAGIIWSIPEIEDSATLDAVIDADSDLTEACFPLSVNFGSKTSISGIKINKAFVDGSQVEFSVENRLIVDSYTVEEN